MWQQQQPQQHSAGSRQHTAAPKIKQGGLPTTGVWVEKKTVDDVAYFYHPEVTAVRTALKDVMIGEVQA